MAVECRQIIENLSTEFRAKVGQSTPKSQISNPRISPKWGPIPPNKNHFSQGRQSYKMHGSDGGCGPPKGVNPTSAPKVPHPPTFDPHCSKLSNLIFVKFSASLEGTCGCGRQSKNRKSVDRVPSNSRPKFAKKAKNAKIQTPISPPNGGRFSPNKNHFSQGRQGCKRQWSVWGCGPKSQKCPTPQISTPIARIPRI